MSQFLTRTHRTLAAFVAAAALGACDTDGPTLPATAQSDELTLALNVSSMAAGPGELIAVALDQSFDGTIGGLQGYLNYNPSRLEYVGHSTDEGIMFVNAREAESGKLRLAALRQGGYTGDIGSLVFRVRQGGYTSSLSFDFEEASVLVPNRVIEVHEANVHPWVMEDRSLRVDEGATQFSATDWMRRLAPNENARASITMARPGEYKADLRYGDANLSGGAPTIGDVVFLLNVSVGFNQLIVDADTTAANRRDAVIAGNVSPDNSPGLGEIGDALRPGVTAALPFGEITLSDATSVLNELANPAQVVVGEIIPGRSATLASNRIVISSNITTNTTWTNTNIYELQGGIQVTNGATLTIQPGTRVEGQRGSGPGVGGAALFVQRDGRLIADGTPLQPIVFTCVGTPKAKGCWGGLTVNGNARLNEGTATSPAVSGRDGGQTGCLEKSGEGTSGLYGGCNDADSSGVLRYAIIEYSGFRFTTTNELNGIAFQGVGSKTVLDFIQVHGGQDDGIEFFGGSVNAKHIYLTASSDDALDWTEGWRGKVQFVIAQADSLDGDKGIEADGSTTQFTALPLATPQIWNMTIVGKADPAGTGGADPNNNVEGGMHIRRGTRPSLNNFIVMGYPHILDIDDTETCITDANGGPFQVRNSAIQLYTTVQNTDTGDPAGCGSEEVFLMGGGNTIGSTGSTIVLQLFAPFNAMTPDFRPVFGSGGGGLTPPSDGFFDVTATYIGAVNPKTASEGNIPWYAGWTRGWQTVVTP
jgi:hypothetical protein